MRSDARGLAADHTPNENINRRLAVYSAAAVTAGVGMLALAQPAEGSVVITKVNIPISSGTQIDLNKDGINDFVFTFSKGGYDHSFYATLAVQPLTGGKVVGGARGSVGPYASALAKSANIGPSAHFSSSAGRGQLVIERSNGSVSGPTSHYKLYGKWGSATNQYLGVRFLIKGAIHYGWIKMTITRLSGTITEYAYETVAGKKIVATGASAGGAVEAAGESANTKPSGPAIGMLALGADGLALWRRE